MRRNSRGALTSGPTGTSTGVMYSTKGYKKRQREKKKKEEEYWASLNGPVIIKKAGVQE